MLLHFHSAVEEQTDADFDGFMITDTDGEARQGWRQAEGKDASR